jgi:hypothetical protein
MHVAARPIWAALCLLVWTTACQPSNGGSGAHADDGGGQAGLLDASAQSVADLTISTLAVDVGAVAPDVPQTDDAAEDVQIADVPLDVPPGFDCTLITGFGSDSPPGDVVWPSGDVADAGSVTYGCGEADAGANDVADVAGSQACACPAGKWCAPCAKTEVCDATAKCVSIVGKPCEVTVYGWSALTCKGVYDPSGVCGPPGAQNCVVYECQDYTPGGAFVAVGNGPSCSQSYPNYGPTPCFWLPDGSVGTGFCAGNQCILNPTLCGDGNPCTTHEGANNCTTKPIEGPCRINGACGKCIAGTCKACAPPTLSVDIEFPDDVGVDAIALTAEDAYIVTGIAPKGDGNRWYARYSSTGQLEWRKWLGTAKTITHMGNFQNGDALALSIPKGATQASAMRLDHLTGEFYTTPAQTPASSLPYQDYRVLPNDVFALGGGQWTLSGPTGCAWPAAPLCSAFDKYHWYCDGKYSLVAGHACHVYVQGGMPGPSCAVQAFMPFIDVGCVADGACGTAQWPGLTAGLSIKNTYSAPALPGDAKSAIVVDMGSAPNGNLIVWGGRPMTGFAWQGNVNVLPFAAWVTTGGSTQHMTDFKLLPKVGFNSQQNEISGAVLPTNGVVVMSGGVLAWTDAAGEILGSMMVEALFPYPEYYAFDPIDVPRILHVFPDGSVAIGQMRRIVRLQLAPACP